jgi:hypothetical protein
VKTGSRELATGSRGKTKRSGVGKILKLCAMHKAYFFVHVESIKKIVSREKKKNKMKDKVSPRGTKGKRINAKGKSFSLKFKGLMPET